MSKRPYTHRGTERFATSRSQGLSAEQTNRGHTEAAASQAVPPVCAERRGQRCREHAARWSNDPSLMSAIPEEPDALGFAGSKV